MLWFSLRRLLIGVAICAVGVFGLQRANVLFRGNYEPFVRQIRAVKGLRDVQVAFDYELGAREVELLTFRIDGKPRFIRGNLEPRLRYL